MSPATPREAGAPFPGDGRNPPLVYRGTVRPEWIDYNGHLNLAYYMVVFDHGTDAFWDAFGLDEGYRARTGTSTYALESHVVYHRELREGDPVRITTQLLDFDAKRLHQFHRLQHDTAHYLAATNELLFINVAVGRSKSAPFDADMLGTLARIMRAHRLLPRPPEAGRMGIRRR